MNARETDTTDCLVAAGLALGDVKAWLRAINGVRRVIRLELRAVDGRVTDPVAVSQTGLPRWVAGAANKIEVKRPEPGRPR